MALSASDMERLAEELHEQARTKENERQKVWLNAEIQKGLDDIKAGRTVSAEEAMAHHEAYRSEWLAKRAAS
jgi:predicted transcriptional regulator